MDPSHIVRAQRDTGTFFAHPIDIGPYKGRNRPREEATLHAFLPRKRAEEKNLGFIALASFRVSFRGDAKV